MGTRAPKLRPAEWANASLQVERKAHLERIERTYLLSLLVIIPFGVVAVVGYLALIVWAVLNG